MSEAAQAVQRAVDELKQEGKVEKKRKQMKSSKKASGRNRAPKMVKNGTEKDYRLFLTNLESVKVVNRGLKLLVKSDDVSEAESATIDRLLKRIAARLG